MHDCQELVEELIAQGALGRHPILEFSGHAAARALGGVAVVRWRRDYLDARSTGVLVRVSCASELPTVDRALVHVQKSRRATWQELARAWRHVRLGGALVVVGAKDLGIRGVARQLASELGCAPTTLAYRGHARAVRFDRTTDAGLVAPEPLGFSVSVGPVPGFAVESQPGVFSADRLDRGSALLLDSLVRVPTRVPPRDVLDLGCGTGVLGLWALLRWPDACAVFADGDLGAVESTMRNGARLALLERMSSAWWDANERLLSPWREQFDLVLLNPPFHRGRAVDLEIPRAMIAVGRECLTSRGELRLVANRSLPYEQWLGVGFDELGERDGYKVLRAGSAGR